MPQTRILSASDLTCPKSPYGETHHFVPIHNSLVCSYCRKTEQDVRNETPMLHAPTRCHCNSCAITRSDRCGTCHLAISVHARNFL